MQSIFIAIVFIASLYLVWNLYEGYKFKSNPISQEIQAKIDAKEQEVLKNIKLFYGIDFRVPLIVSDELPSKLYGVAVLDKSGSIKIYINKKRIRESLDYILDDVIAHEYAHALVFASGNFNHDDGHSEQWQKICINLGGSRCDRFVNHNDIIYGKIGI